MKPESYNKLFYTLLAISFILAPIAGITGISWLFHVIPVAFFGAMWADNKSKETKGDL